MCSGFPSHDPVQIDEDSFGAIALRGFDELAKVHPDVPVILDLVVCPSIAKRVKNPYWFRSAGDPEHMVTRYVNRECPQVDQLAHGGNVGSMAMILAKFWCFSRHVCILGYDSSFKEGTKSNGYWYNADMPQRHHFVDVVDIYGRPITTMMNLHNYKWWAEHFCWFNDDVEWINCNDGGFLGVASPVENYNHFKYMPLEMAVEYLKDHSEDN